MSRFHPAVLAAALWAAVAVRLVRGRLKQDGLHARVPPPPRVGRRGGIGVRAALRRLSPTCLERALVEQAWLASVGTPRDVVIGVPHDGMTEAPAHAWVGRHRQHFAHAVRRAAPPPASRRGGAAYMSTHGRH